MEGHLAVALRTYWTFLLDDPSCLFEALERVPQPPQCGPVHPGAGPGQPRAREPAQVRPPEADETPSLIRQQYRTRILGVNPRLHILPLRRRRIAAVSATDNRRPPLGSHRVPAMRRELAPDSARSRPGLPPLRDGPAGDRAKWRPGLPPLRDGPAGDRAQWRPGLQTRHATCTRHRLPRRRPSTSKRGPSLTGRHMYYNM